MKSVFLVFLSCFAFSIGIMGADLQPSQNEKGKWGFVDASGTPVVDYKYDEVVSFDGNFAKVCKKNKWGVIDSTGMEVLKPMYSSISDFDNGMARIALGNQYGYINQNMEIVVPCKFTSIGTFNDKGLVWVSDGSKYGIYRNDGSIFIQPKYKTIGTFIPWINNFNASDFEKASYSYTSHYRLNGSHHLLRKKKLEPGLFSKLPEDPIGYYYSADADAYKNSVVTPEGTILVEAGKYRTPFYPSEGIIPVWTKTDKFNYINVETGNLLLDKDIAGGWAFSDGIAIALVKNDGKAPSNLLSEAPKKDSKIYYQFIDKDGKPVTSEYYDEIFPKVNDVYITLKDGKYGMADSKGKTILPASYNQIVSTSGKYFAAQKNDNENFGFLDSKGQWVSLPCYSSVGAYNHGYYGVKKDDLWGLLDGEGNNIINCEWKRLIIPSQPDQDLFWVSNQTGDDATFQVYSRTKKGLAFRGAYKGVWNFDHHYPGIALVHNGEGKFGCIDASGNVVIPLEFDNFDIVKTGYEALLARKNKVWRSIDTHRLKLSGDAANQSYRLNQKINNENWEY